MDSQESSVTASQFRAAAVPACKEPNPMCVCLWFCVWLWAVGINGAGKRAARWEEVASFQLGARGK